MYMDYMDFTDDIGMHMFTDGQRDRMRTLFMPGGSRYALLSSPAAAAPAGEPETKVSGSGAVLLTPSLYPNPASSYISVTLRDASQVGGLLEVYNQMGQIVIAMRVTGTSFQLNVSGLAGGLYFMRLVGGGSQEISKFVKM